MKTSIMKSLLAVIVLALPIPFSGCGKAQYTGYNAPDDAYVNFGTYGECSPTSLSADTSGCYLVTVVTSRTTHDEVITTGPDEPIEIGEDKVLPVGGIQVQLVGDNVTVYHATNGSAWLLADTPIEELTLPTMIKTNDNGFYQLRTCVSGAGSLYANIGWASCSITLE